ncbi:DUF5777 family beta-barrel protein [Flagellimonas flava]|uniref:DUF5777 family beta-barrel protein n=1 Tax=Flagellimonas flava TaxID=570519 RepID=UPI003D65B4FE
MKTRVFWTLLVFGLFVNQIMAQNELLDILEKEHTDTVPQYVTATFKSTRITYGHSVETRKKGILEVFAATRFWNTPTLRSQSFGADKLNARIALEYGMSDRLTTGVGGSTWDGLFDAFVKYRLVRQQPRGQGSPIGLTVFQNASYNSHAISNPNVEDDFSNRLSFTTQLLIAKKINSDFSLQITPTFIHRSAVYTQDERQNHLALGFGGRYKLGPHVSLVSEYYRVFNPVESIDTYGPFGIGVNWELGDVMLQFMLTNAPSMVESSFIAETRNNFNFKNPNLNFGFNFTYIIHFKRQLKGLKQENKTP